MSASDQTPDPRARMRAIMAERPDNPALIRESDGPWHAAVNGYHDARREEQRAKSAATCPACAGKGDRHAWGSGDCSLGEAPRSSFMYEAKRLSVEVPRMALLFGMERRGELPAVHRQCSLSETEPVRDNHLTCCLGVETRKCPELIAIGAAKLAPEETDRAKAWTCGAHIVSAGGDVSGEGYLLDETDKMFWARAYESMASGPAEDEHDGEAPSHV